MRYRALPFPCIWLTLGLLYGVQAWAAPPFERVGKIDRVSPRQGIIVINDVRYALPASVRVYLYQPARGSRDAAQREYGNRYALRPGMRIGYTVTGEGPGRTGSLVAVWILPPGSAPKYTE